MDGTLHFMFSQYLQYFSEYLSLLQHLSIILLTAIAYLAYSVNLKKHNHICCMLSIAFILGISSLIIGLCMYGSIIDKILEMRAYPKNIDLTDMNFWIKCQFWLNVTSLGLLTIVLFILQGEKNANA